jgi:hypothetical protein
MLFLDGRCRAQNLCHQAHVDLEVIEYLRKEALSMPTCCLEHGDLHSSNVAQIVGEGRQVWLHGRPLDTWNIANTLGLQRVARECPAGRDIELMPRNICRLHLGNKCRYVEECNHVHICRELKDLVIPSELSFSASSVISVGEQSPSTPPTPALSETNLPPTPLALSTPKEAQRWSHSPYHWKVLGEYDYLPENELDAMSAVRQT